MALIWLFKHLVKLFYNLYKPPNYTLNYLLNCLCRWRVSEVRFVFHDVLFDDLPDIWCRLIRRITSVFKDNNSQRAVFSSLIWSLRNFIKPVSFQVCLVRTTYSSNRSAASIFLMCRRSRSSQLVLCNAIYRKLSVVSVGAEVYCHGRPCSDRSCCANGGFELDVLPASTLCFRTVQTHARPGDRRL